MTYTRYYLLLALIGFAVYANSLSNDFVFDDESVVLGDPSITKISNIPRYFTGQEGFHKVIGRYYRPVISASYALDYALYGFSSFGFHLTNILIHIINCLLLYKLLLLIFVRGRDKNKTFQITVFLAAIIFAVHPIHTEAVAWISGRTDSLSFTFFIAAFICYLRYKETGAKKYFSLTAFMYFLSLLAKEMALTLPVLLFLYDVIAGKSFRLNQLKKNFGVYSALIAVSVLYIALRWLILKDVPQRETYFYFYGKDLVTVIATMLQTLPLYFKLLFFPTGLVYHYSGFLPYQDSFLNINVILSLVFVAVMLFLVVLLYKKFPLTSYSILFFFTSLFPVLNIIPTMNFIAERFLYIPSLIVSIILAEIASKFNIREWRKFVSASLIAIILAYSYLTFTRNADWKTDDTLFLSAEGKPGTVTYVNIGNIYANKNQIDVAEVYYRKAIDLRNETLLAHNNLGKVFLVRGVYDSAIYYMTKAYLLDTLSPEPMLSLAQTYTKMGNLQEAIKYLEKIQKVTPKYMNSAQMLEQLKSQLHEKTQNIDPAEIKRIAQLEQDSYRDYQNKEYNKSIKALLELIKLHPDGAAGYYNNIGMCYLEQDEFKDAVKYFKLSIENKNDFSTAYNNLGYACEKLGDAENARENYRKSLDIDPNNQDAKKNLERMK